MQIASKSVAEGSLLYSKHANERMLERGIIKPEVEFVLNRGHHEVKKDQYNEVFSSWDYAITAKTVDGRNLRIIISVMPSNVLVITEIDLDQ